MENTRQMMVDDEKGSHSDRVDPNKAYEEGGGEDKNKEEDTVLNSESTHHYQSSTTVLASPAPAPVPDPNASSTITTTTSMETTTTTTPTTIYITTTMRMATQSTCTIANTLLQDTPQVDGVISGASSETAERQGEGEGQQGKKVMPTPMTPPPRYMHHQRDELIREGMEEGVRRDIESSPGRRDLTNLPPPLISHIPSALDSTLLPAHLRGQTTSSILFTPQSHQQLQQHQQADSPLTTAINTTDAKRTFTTRIQDTFQTFTTWLLRTSSSDQSRNRRNSRASSHRRPSLPGLFPDIEYSGTASALTTPANQHQNGNNKRFNPPPPYSHTSNTATFNTTIMTSLNSNYRSNGNFYTRLSSSASSRPTSDMKSPTETTTSTATEEYFANRRWMDAVYEWYGQGVNGRYGNGNQGRRECLNGRGIRVGNGVAPARVGRSGGSTTTSTPVVVVDSGREDIATVEHVEGIRDDDKNKEREKGKRDEKDKVKDKTKNKAKDRRRGSNTSSDTFTTASTTTTSTEVDVGDIDNCNNGSGSWASKGNWRTILQGGNGNGSGGEKKKGKESKSKVKEIKKGKEEEGAVVGTVGGTI